MRAAGANCLECVRLLLAHGSDVNAVSNEARAVKAGLQEHGKLTPLLFAAERRLSQADTVMRHQFMQAQRLALLHR